MQHLADTLFQNVHIQIVAPLFQDFVKLAVPDSGMVALLQHGMAYEEVIALRLSEPMAEMPMEDDIGQIALHDDNWIYMIAHQ